MNLLATSFQSNSLLSFREIAKQSIMLVSSVQLPAGSGWPGNVCDSCMSLDGVYDPLG